MTAEQQSEFMLVWQGREYRVEDLTMNDVGEMEDEFGERIEDLMTSGRIRPLIFMVWLLRRHAEPDLALADVGALSMGEFMAEVKAAQEAAAGPPTKAPAGSRKSAAGGGRGSRASTASARGKSDS